jgi:hypothetical protein
MTGDEAKTKWCPFAGLPRFTHQSEECVGAACMAWEWRRQEYVDGVPLPMGTAPADPGWEIDGTVWCTGGEYGTGEKRQRWRRALPRTGSFRLVGGRPRTRRSPKPPPPRTWPGTWAGRKDV